MANRFITPISSKMTHRWSNIEMEEFIVNLGILSKVYMDETSWLSKAVKKISNCTPDIQNYITQHCSLSSDLKKLVSVRKLPFFVAFLQK